VVVFRGASSPLCNAAKFGLFFMECSISVNSLLMRYSFFSRAASDDRSSPRRGTSFITARPPYSDSRWVYRTSGFKSRPTCFNLSWICRLFVNLRADSFFLFLQLVGDTHVPDISCRRFIPFPLRIPQQNWQPPVRFRSLSSSFVNDVFMPAKLIGF